MAGELSKRYVMKFGEANCDFNIIVLYDLSDVCCTNQITSVEYQTTWIHTREIIIDWISFECDEGILYLKKGDKHSVGMFLTSEVLPSPEKTGEYTKDLLKIEFVEH